MVKKRIIFLFIIIVVITTATGCNSDFFNLDERKVTVKMSALPSDYNNYVIKIFAESDGGGVKNVFEYEDISPTQTLNKSLEISREADFIMVYLFDNEYSYYDPDFDDPVYFYRYNLSESKNTYNFSYWLDYYSFESYDEIEYGLSEQLVQNVETSMTKEIDFSEEKYYLYKIPYNVVNNDVQITSKMSSGAVDIVYDDSLSGLYDGYYDTYTEGDQIIKDYYNFESDLYILVTPQDYDVETNGTIEITIN